jgi:hypothetical protein
MEKYERKNKENPHRTPRSGFTMFPSLRGEMDWWKYRSRSPLSFPSKICKNHGRNGGGRASYSKSTMEEREARFVAGSRRKKGYLYPLPKNVTIAVPGEDYPGQVGAEYPPPGLSGQKSASIIGSEPPESSTRKQ